MGISTISIAIFMGHLLVYQRVSKPAEPSCEVAPSRSSSSVLAPQFEAWPAWPAETESNWMAMDMSMDISYMHIYIYIYIYIYMCIYIYMIYLCLWIYLIYLLIDVEICNGKWVHVIHWNRSLQGCLKIWSFSPPVMAPCFWQCFSPASCYAATRAPQHL